jgi:hypothetical protein
MKISLIRLRRMAMPWPDRGDQTVQGPAGKGQAQVSGPGQGRGDHGAALLGRVCRRSPGAHVLFQPVRAMRIEPVEPMANRVAAQIHPAGDLLRLEAAQGMDDDLGTADERRSKSVRARDPLNLRRFRQVSRHLAGGWVIGVEEPL